jgi:hypothetical protein
MPSLTAFYIQYYSVAVNGDGSLASKTVTAATVTVTTASNGATFTGQYTATTIGPTGTPPVSTTGTINGTLIPHPALP